MPSIPRIRRQRHVRAAAGELGARAEPRIKEVTAHGLTWVHLERIDAETLQELADRFGWHELDQEDVLDDLFDYCFPMLDKIGHKLDVIEDDLFEERSEDAVRDISNVKQEIISYRKIIKPERPTLRVLERHTARFLPEELDLYFDDLVDAAERIWDMLDNYKEVVEALEDTNESVIGHQTNYRLQILTVVSVVLLPLTLIASVFGMNVGLPGEGDLNAFWALLAVMVALGLFLLGLF